MSDPNQYTVGWVCALSLEYVAALEMLDETHDSPEQLSQNDTNVYTLGKIRSHNIVIAVLPEGDYGTTAAANVTKDMIRTFPNIKIGLMVGIGGGAPSAKHDIRLGDVVVGVPSAGVGGVLQYDLGKSIQNKAFHITGNLNQPPAVLLSAVSALKAKYARHGPQIQSKIDKVLQKNRRLKRVYARPDESQDHLYDPDFVHMSDDMPCEFSCALRTDQIQKRDERNEEDGDDIPNVHYGLIASANTVMKDATVRDRLARQKKVICFEMEAAGLMNRFPCLVVRGICDYCDTHKNDIWQPYSALAAAVYTKDLLAQINARNLEAQDIMDLREIKQALSVQKDMQIEQAITTAISSLPRCASAAYNSLQDENKAHCLEGTQIEILQTIRNWVDDLQRPPIFWLRGMAGTGKSTIARTIAHQYRIGTNPSIDQVDSACVTLPSGTVVSKSVVGVTFFFNQQDDGRNKANLLFSTIARDLSIVFPTYRRHLYDALKQHEYIMHQKLKDQWETILLGPLQKCYEEDALPSVLIILDALDECETEARWLQILQLFSNSKQLESLPLRFFITSRPENQIRRGFQDIANSRLLNIKTLEKIPLSKRGDSKDDDITLFFKTELSDLRTTHELEEAWPGANKIRLLALKANGLFIWAATAIRFLRSADFDFVDSRLDLLLEGDIDTVHETSPQESLDQIYTQVLKASVLKSALQHEKGIIGKSFQQVVGTILCLAHPLSLNELHGLLSIQFQKMERVLGNLHSILSVPNDRDSPIGILHLSFRDFLVSERCQEDVLRVDEEETHYQLFKECIRVMSETFESDTRESMIIPKPNSKYAKEFDALRVDEYLPDHVKYACKYWVHHLQSSKKVPVDGDEMHLFLLEHLIPWLEAMGLMKGESEAIESLNSLLELLGSQNDLYSLVLDAKRFSMANKDIIRRDPFQLSIGVAFAPTDSLIQKYFSGRRPYWLKSVSGIRSRWGDLLQTLHTANGETICGAVFSTDGKLIAGWAKAADGSSNSISIWNAFNGVTHLQIQISGPAICGVTFTPDQARILTVSEDLVFRLWDIETALELKSFSSQAQEEICIHASFVLDGPQISMVSFSDKNSLVWNISPDLEAADFKISPAKSARFSKDYAPAPHFVLVHDGKLVAVVVDDYTLEIRDIKKQTLVSKVGVENRPIDSVGISQAQRMVAISNKNEIALFDVDTGKKLKIICPEMKRKGICVYLRFSPDGSMVAAEILGEGDGSSKLYVWNTITGLQLMCVPTRHFLCVTPFAFAPGRLIIAKLWDKDIHLRDLTVYGEGLDSLKALESAPSIAAIDDMVVSPDGKTLLAKSLQGWVEFWDLPSQTLRRRSPPHVIPGYEPRDVIRWSKDSKFAVITCYEFNDADLWEIDDEGIRSTTLQFSDSFKNDFGGQLLLAPHKKFQDGHLPRYQFKEDPRITPSNPDSSLVEHRCIDLETGISWLGFMLKIAEGAIVAKQSPTNSLLVIETDCLLLYPHGHAPGDISYSTPSEPFKLEGSERFRTNSTFSKNGKLLAASNESTSEFCVWELERFTTLTISEPCIEAEVEARIQGLAFSTDGDYLAVSTDANIVKIYDWELGTTVGTCTVEEWRTREISLESDLELVWHDTQNTLSIPFPRLTLRHYAPNFSRRYFLRDSWVCLGLEMLIWVNPDYHAKSIAESGNLIAIGTAPVGGDGKVILIQVV